MRIIISTHVKKNYQVVFARFGEALFLRLNPPLIPIKLLRFDGMQVDDEVHLELSFFHKKQKWVSRITEFVANPDEIYFVDEGIQLPSFLKSWRHQHRIVRQNGHTVIIDDIRFHSTFRVFDYLLYPFLYLQFLYRKPVYKKALKA